MSKEKILKSLKDIEENKYIWNLYFFDMDRRNNNPYKVYKHTLRKDKYLYDYVIYLSKMISEFQLKEIEEVEEYSGQNCKTSCDKISISNPLIKTSWEKLVEAVSLSERKNTKEKYKGYILEGHPEEEGLETIIIVKSANPIISMKGRKSKIFLINKDDELDDMTDKLCKLQGSADFIVIDQTLYTFNYKFEKILGLESTFKKKKIESIKRIIETDAFANSNYVEKVMQSYKSEKIFLTINDTRINKLKTIEGRKEIAKIISSYLDEEHRIVLNDDENVKNLVKYLCYKIIEEKETDDILEVNNVVGKIK